MMIFCELSEDELATQIARREYVIRERRAIADIQKRCDDACRKIDEYVADCNRRGVATSRSVLASF